MPSYSRLSMMALLGQGYLGLEKHPGPGCSKLTTSLVNVSLKFQTLIS